MAEHDALGNDPEVSPTTPGESSDQTEADKGIEAADAQAAFAALQRFQSGANWFFWIAALSIVNSAILLAGSEWGFVIGLAITQLFDGIAHAIAQEAPDAGTVVKLVAFGLDLIAAGIFVGFGVLARMRHTWAFVVGMVLYAMDGLLFLLLGDLLSTAFHGFALYCMWNGMKALGALKQLAAEAAPPPEAQPAFPD